MILLGNTQLTKINTTFHDNTDTLHTRYFPTNTNENYIEYENERFIGEFQGRQLLTDTQMDMINLPYLWNGTIDQFTFI